MVAAREFAQDLVLVSPQKIGNGVVIVGSNVCSQAAQFSFVSSQARPKIHQVASRKRPNHPNHLCNRASLFGWIDISEAAD
jgi:hypothetical protein